MSEGESLSRLRWRCRRGMRELDVVLLRYLEQCYPDASDAHREAFHALIELSDPELFDLLRGHTEGASPEVAAVVGELRRPG